MNLDCYTQYIPLTSKARFWGNFVSALKGKTRDERLTRLTSLLRLKRPVRQSCPPREDILPLHRGGAAPGGDEAEAGVREARGPHVEEQARDLPASYSSPPRGQRQVRGSHCSSSVLYWTFRIHTLGYNYCPVHTEIYGSYRNRDRRLYY